MSAPASTGAETEPVVTVWWAHRSLAAALDAGQLSDAERQRVARLRGVADRERSAVARGVLRLALASSFPDTAEFVIDWAHGPVLPSDLGTWASVSHSDDSVAVAVSAVAPIGIDVEAIRRTSDLVPAVQEAVFTAEERGELKALPAGERLPAALRLWTLKEAVLKSTGDGLVRAPSTLQVSGVAATPRLDRFDTREDLIGATQLFGLAPVVQPYRSPDDDDAPLLAAAPAAVGSYVASLAVLTNVPVRVIQRDAAELLV